MTTSDAFPDLNLGQKSFSKQSHQFWTLQIFGWLGYVIVVFIAIVRPQFDDPNFYLAGQLINLAIEASSGFLLSYMQWLIIRKTVHWPLKKTLILSFGSAAILGGVFNVIKLASYKTIVYQQIWYQQWNMLEFGGWLLFSVSTMFVWTAIFFIMLYNTKLQKEHEMLLRAQNSAKEAQLQMLRYQLNPHFMFNTMNAISTLIYKKDNEKAGDMLDKLCEFFRYSLDQNSNQESQLHREIELLNVYLAIEKVRFGERLTVNLDIDKQVSHGKVPSLFLQPIVENAIKYGIESRKQPGVISISAKAKNQRLRIEVLDSGKGEVTDSGFGIGLTNTRERLSSMFNDDISIDIQHTESGTRVSLDMPFQRG
ncbi:histidine kinase [Thalassotalea sp. M1531]|uniref:Histidine kinase n=2 Tax=Thalassotalea algicola TaxID=2716224 RepID=A0A7Y0Q5J4_9GAMM|nr:histidine kinase [Thalassotalea algicola]